MFIVEQIFDKLLDIVVYCSTLPALDVFEAVKTMEEKDKDTGKKDRILQTRVSQTLYQDLVRQARRLRVPVSNLVRNMLEDSLTMVGNIVDGGLEIAEALTGGTSEKELREVLGWQPITVNRQLHCASCGNRIEKGKSALIGVGAPSGRTFIICEDCQCNIAK